MPLTNRKSIYLSKSNQHYYDSLKEWADEKGVSLSKLIGDNMESLVYEQMLDVRITPFAYIAISANALQDLDVMMDGNTKVLTVKSNVQSQYVRLIEKVRNEI